MGFFADKTALKLLKERLLLLEERCDLLERQGKSLRLEWEETYDKVSHQMSRISRRVASSASQSKGLNELPLADSDTSSGPDPISRSIMLRRGMQGIK